MSTKMHVSKILHHIAESGPEAFEQPSTRRGIICNWMPKIVLAAAPLALSSLFNRAYGKTTDAISDALKQALTMERLLSSFYSTALTKPALFPVARPSDKQAIQLISANSDAHKSFLDTMLASVGASTADVPNTFDYTAGKGTNAGPFADVFTNYVTFLAVAQVLEDLSVRHYKGATATLMSNHDVLQGAFQVHSVKARHAAKIRQLRTENGHATIKPWITQAVSGIPNAAAQAPYAGESNTLQGGMDVSTVVSSNAATEAFDEPMGKDAVMAILVNFIKP